MSGRLKPWEPALESAGLPGRNGPSNSLGHRACGAVGEHSALGADRYAQRAKYKLQDLERESAGFRQEASRHHGHVEDDNRNIQWQTGVAGLPKRTLIY